jgi:hypothetical protein
VVLRVQSLPMRAAVMASQASLAVRFLESENCISDETVVINCGPLDVVGLGEGRPPAAGTDVPDNGLDPIVTMVPVRGGRVVPPVKTTISVNPAADASAPVWAAVAVRDTAATRAPSRSAAGAFAPVRAVAMAPLGVHGCPLHRLLPRCLPRQLELIVSVIIGRNRAIGATGAQSLELYRRHTCMHPPPLLLLLLPLLLPVTPLTSLVALAAVAAVSAAARSRSSATATSASCRCCALKATER